MAERLRIPIHRPSERTLRAWISVTAALCLVVVPGVGARALAVVLALVGVICVLLVAASPREDGSLTPLEGRREGGGAGAVVVLTGLLAGLGATVTMAYLAAPALWALGLAACVGVVSALAVASARLSPWCMVLLVPLQVTLWLTVTARVDRPIDVAEFMTGGADAILRGESPYAITIANVYSTTESARVYAPGTATDDRVLLGYPYLPTPLLAALPGHVAGDHRYVLVAAMLFVAIAAFVVATDSVGRAMAIILLLAPTSSAMLIGHWVEPTIAALAVGAALVLRAGRAWSGPILGLFLASKQYLVVVLPALWTTLALGGRRAALVGVATAAAIIAAFAAWDVGSFVETAVVWQFKQPYRDDSVSLIPIWVAVVGDVPRWITGVLPLVLGLVASSVIVRSLAARASTFLIAIGLPLLCTVLVSKQAFTNYYWLIGSALAFASVLMARESDTGAVVPRVPGSAGHRGDQVREPAKAPEQQAPAHQARHRDGQQDEQQRQGGSHEDA